MDSFINQSCYQFGKDIVTVALTVWGLIIATKGLVTWRKQIRGTKEFEAGYNLNYSLLKLRNAIRHVRNPAIWPSESYKAIQYSRAKYPNKNEADIEKNSHAYVYEMRWEEISGALTEVESHLLAAEVLWGKEILSLMQPLNNKITELNIALEQYFQPELRTKPYMDLHNIIYNKAHKIDEDDQFGAEVSKVVQDIVDYIKIKIS